MKHTVFTQIVYNLSLFFILISCNKTKNIDVENENVNSTNKKKYVNFFKVKDQTLKKDDSVQNIGSKEISTTVLQLKRVGGIYEIPCKINEVDFDFFFDTGASDVTISLNAAKKLFSLGKLESSDIIGRQFYQVADGTLSEGVTIVLKEIKIDKIKLKNVKASIILNGNAPLLLGQTALEKNGDLWFPNSYCRFSIWCKRTFR